eukprot:Sspe_Gene.69741::Locus_41126_Transcript_1_1_Confidence_1.000_Length_1525::g.69741::m.69741/K15731/CTDSP; carboxy-terminal domain RNA polymerase II polypeptide A small phosphatase
MRTGYSGIVGSRDPVFSSPYYSSGSTTPRGSSALYGGSTTPRSGSATPYSYEATRTTTTTYYREGGGNSPTRGRPGVPDYPTYQSSVKYGAPATPPSPLKYPSSWESERRPSPGPAQRRSVLEDNPYSTGSSFKSSLTATSYGGPGRTSLLNPYTAPQSDYHSSFKNTSFSAAPPTLNAPPSPTSQRVRGISFRNEYSGNGMGSPRMRRAPSMVHTPGTHMLPPQDPADASKYVVVLDLDETLIYARDGPLYARPGLEEFLALLSKGTEAVAWTAGLRAYAQAVLANIDRMGAFKHCIYRHHKWFTGQAGYQKDLKLLGRNLDKVIIIENTPDCIRHYRDHGVLVADYEGGEKPDNTIPMLTEFIRGLISSGLTVPQYLAKCHLLTKRRVLTDVGDYIECYWLDVNAAMPSYGSPKNRVNRDLPVEHRLYGR